MRGSPLLGALLVMALGLGSSCRSASSEASERLPARASIPSPETTDTGASMSTSNLRGNLPENFDIRVRRVLDEALGADVVLAFDRVAMAKSPRTNYRFTLSATGAMRYVQHSGAGGDWQVPFDRPLPDKPSKQVDPAKASALVAGLESAGFFTHPGYEADPRAEDGSYYILRVRKGQALHTVVYQNVEPPRMGELSALADPLWVQPK
jgi:hypothetical protein